MLCAQEFVVTPLTFNHALPEQELKGQLPDSPIQDDSMGWSRGLDSRHNPGPRMEKKKQHWRVGAAHG